MGRFVQMVDRYINKMRLDVSIKERRYLTRNPEDFSKSEINDLIDWCRDQIADLDKSVDEVNELIHNFNRTQAGRECSVEEYNDTQADIRALDYLAREMRKLYQRLNKLIDTYIDYSDR